MSSLSRKFNMDTQQQNFWKETINKEKLLSLCWLRRYQPDPCRPPPRKRERRKLFRLPKIENTSVTVSIPNDMRPVTPQTRALLYDGFSKEEKGRYQYLKARVSKGPDEKYEYPFTTSWDYGWRLGDMVKYQTPAHGRSAIIQGTFYRKNGIFASQEATDVVD
ncbi:protein ATP6V1FNB [Callorhinchus milii]|uniref:protein ATP6V1FNB n=1 Tax=Callorhinchus milii TaxID=7868 RepID=UPI001C3FEB74|nr:protein ATP6V1FNB [Callorhinchus milii]